MQWLVVVQRSERAEERADVLREQLGFLQGCEVAASRHLGPALDVEEALGGWDRSLGNSANAAGTLLGWARSLAVSRIQRTAPAWAKS